MTSLRVNFFAQYVFPQGTYFRFHNLAVGLVKLEQHVTVFGCDPARNAKEREEIRDGVTYHIIPELRGTRFFGLGCHPLTAARRCFLDYPACDVAHLYQPFPSAAWPWQWSMRGRDGALFYDWDDLWIGGAIHIQPKSLNERWTRMCVNNLEQRLPAKSQHVTTCSQFLADLALERGARDVNVIHNGFWPVDIPDKETARRELGLEPGALYVGFMGRTTAELSWCFKALEMNMHRHQKLRFALCGVQKETLRGVCDEVWQRVDFLGDLPPLKTRDFAAAIDLGLLPLENNPFNQSRFPIKFSEYMAAGTPVLASDVGECAMLSEKFPWVIKAGRTETEWLDAFSQAVNSMSADSLPHVDIKSLEALLSWSRISQKLLDVYLLHL
jgi:glycosyltransferase involved in cell wall biosynthesis